MQKKLIGKKNNGSIPSWKESYDALAPLVKPMLNHEEIVNEITAKVMGAKKLKWKL